MIIDISSTNPQLSWILSKNPATTNVKPFSKKLRHGNVLGWYPQSDTFRLYFVDGVGVSSFNQHSDFEYLDRTRYCSTYLPYAMLSNALATAINGTEFDTDQYSTKVVFMVEFTNMHFVNNIAELFRSSKIEVNIRQIQPDLPLYEFAISSNTVQLSLQGACVVSMLLFFIMNRTIDASLSSDEFVERLFRFMHNIAAPYYVKYRIASRLLTEQQFQAVSHYLTTDTCIMNYGNTQEHRYRAIKNVLMTGPVLVDIGCGELFYENRLSKNYETVWAIDGNAQVNDKNIEKSDAWKITNVYPIHQLVDAEYVYNSPTIFNEDSIVLMTEVLEHVEYSFGEAIVLALLGCNVKQIVATVPNAEFNQFYGLSHQHYRHDDHKWEAKSVQDFLQKIEVSYGEFKDLYNIEYHPCGDIVNGIPSTILVNFSKKKDANG